MYLMIITIMKLIIDNGIKQYQDNFISDLEPNLGNVALTSIIINLKKKVFKSSHKTCSKYMNTCKN